MAGNGAGTTAPPSWARVARAADLAGSGPHALSAGGMDLVAVTPEGQTRVFGGLCPHQGALLGEGELVGSELVCRNHRWRFDTASGCRIGGPQKLTACPSEVRDGELHVDVAPLAATVAATRTLRKIADLPGPTTLPFVGNALQLDVPRLHLVMEGWARQYGPVFRMRPGPLQAIGVSDPDLIEQCLRARPETFRRDTRVAPIFAELGVTGVFSAEGAAWRPQRKLAMEALSHRHLKSFYPTLASVAARLQRRWAKEAGRAVDITEDLMRFTVDVTTTLAFGRDLNTIEGGEEVIQRQLGEVFPALARRIFAIIPYWRVLRLPADRRVDRAVKELQGWIGGLIAEARAQHAAAPDREPANFLEAMVAARDTDGNPFSDEIVYGNAMTMLLAGEDTTANSIAWAIHLLCEHPDEVAALRAELDAVMEGSIAPPDLDAANRLDRATAIANEAMRLLPVAPILFLHANKDTVVGDVEVPGGTGVVCITRAPARDARNFAAPDEFRPARWLEGGAEGAHDPSAMIAFGTGPRICPGRTLAMLEMRVVLATLYKSFEVERVGEAAAVKELFSFTVGPSGLRVKLRPRAA